MEAEQRIAELEAENRALKAEAERLRHLLDSAADYAIVTLDLEGRITGWNEGAHAILGYGHGEILGRSGEVFFPAEDRAQGVFVKELCRAVEEGRAPNERWHIRRDGSRFWASGLMMPLLNADGKPEGFLNVFRDSTAVRAEEERRALLLAEMGHRMKNVLATVQAVAAQTLRQTGVPAAVQETLLQRLVALAGSHDLLTRGGWESAPLTDVIQRSLSPYAGSGRVTSDGPPVRLAADTVEVLNLAFHELATNAAKYGALSVPEGRVEVSWALRRTGKGTRLVEIDWREREGPPVTPPKRRGFGSRLLERGLAQRVGGTVKLDFRPEGLECRICLPVAAGE
ncbi:HWE histidine kinase domain-containing protein [Belnapia arida]|uniref:HWE histidine kinase domain-containing protein n=1 Tax=Belnapia arida TaxID=2804533 RepID=UPI001F21EAD8|nr:HWE histidine kinase domain-containing protein [Belnapia arida]